MNPKACIHALLFQPTGFMIAFLEILIYPITRESVMATRRLRDVRRGETQ